MVDKILVDTATQLHHNRNLLLKPISQHNFLLSNFSHNQELNAINKHLTENGLNEEIVPFQLLIIIFKPIENKSFGNDC
jgi:hypothetical protein